MLYSVVIVSSLICSFVLKFSTIKSRPKILLPSLVLPALMLFIPLANAATFLAFGPTTYERTTGKPVTVTNNFSYPRPGDICIAHVYNGGLNFKDYNRVSSAVVTFNSKGLFGPSDFNQKVTHIQKPVTMAADNALSVEVRSKPGSAVVVTIECEVFDTTPPVIISIVDPPANQRGWQNTDTTVSFICSDDQSAIVFCSDPVTVTTEGVGQLVEGRAEDEAGNTATTSVSVNLDKTAPTLTQAVSSPPNADGWNDRDVSIQYTCTDTLSGVDSCPSLKTITTEGANQDISETIVDNAGNNTTVSTTLNIDKSVPVISVVKTPQANANGWNTTDVTVSFDCTDAVSGVRNCPSAKTVSSEGVTPGIVSATDLAGNSTEISYEVKIDKTNPLISATPLPAPTASGWNGEDVTVFFDCSDSLSGIATCPDPITVSEEGENIIVHGTAVDVAGQISEVSVSLNIDKSGPDIVITAPQDGATVSGATVIIEGTVSDTDALQSFLINNQTVTVAQDGSFSYNAPLVDGYNTFELIATDQANNQSSSVLSVKSLGNAPPSITSTPVAQVNENEFYRYDVDATDPNSSDVVSYALDRSPVGMSIDKQTGLIDWTPTADYIGTSTGTDNPSCVKTQLPGIGTFEPVMKWRNRRSLYGVTMTPMVGPLSDTNGDSLYNDKDIPTVLFVMHQGVLIEGAEGILRAVNGRTGKTLWDSAIKTKGATHPAIGDIDGDNIPDIVMYGYDGNIVALNNDGTLKWSVTYPSFAYTYVADAINLADLDGDGNPEILARDHVLNSDGSLRWALPFTMTAGRSMHAADMDLDGVQEVVVGGRVYTADGANYWENQNILNGYTGVGNFDGDPYPEVVTVNAYNIRLTDNDSTVIWERSFPGGGGGAPTIGDFNGDGLPEIGAAGLNYYVVYDYTGKILWLTEIDEGSSRSTSSALFDFDGDGNLEIIYGDEQRLHVFDGSTGAEIFGFENGSATAKEYPLVADVDGDGHAEFLVASDRIYPGVRAYEDIYDSWLPTRKIWNQYDYSINNVNDDGTIPANPGYSWLTHNSFRMAAFPDYPATGRVDLQVGDLTLIDNGDTYTLQVRVTDRGMFPLKNATAVNFYNGNPQSGGTLLGAAAISDLGVGESVSVKLAGIVKSAVTENISATVDEQNNIDECIEENNVTYSALVSVRAEDALGAFDTQLFSVSVADVNEAPTITSSPINEAIVSKPFTYTVTASDPDAGDMVHFALSEAPLGMKVNSITGKITWTPFVSQAGSQNVSVQAIDSHGVVTTQNFFINVADDLDFASHQVCGVIEVGFGPRNMVITPDDSEIYMNYYGVLGTGATGKVNVFSTQSQTITHSIDLAVGAPLWPAVSGDGQFIYMPVTPSNTGTSDKRIDVISTSSHSLVNSISWPKTVNSGPSAVAVAPTGNQIYVSDHGAKQIRRINLVGEIENFSIRNSQSEAPYGIAMNSDGSLIYTVDRNQAVVRVLDRVNGHRVIATIPLSLSYITNSGATRIILSPDGKRAYVTYSVSTDVAVIDTDPNSVSYHQQVDVLPTDGLRVFYSSISRDGRYAYFVSRDSTEILVFDTNPGSATYRTLVHRINTGSPVGDIVMPDPVSNLAYVTSYSTSSIKAICQANTVTQKVPVINSTPVTTAYVYDRYNYDVTVSDNDTNDFFTFRLLQAPAGLTINEQSGAMTWVPGEADIGTYDVAVKVTDLGGLYYVQKFTLNVELPTGGITNEPPVITSAPVTTATEAQAYAYAVIATDTDNDAVPGSDPLTYSLPTAPPGMYIDSTTGVIGWTPTIGQAGMHDVAVRVDDSRGGWVEQSFTIAVATAAPNVGPVINSEPTTTAKSGYAYQYHVVASDPNNDPLNYSLELAPAGMTIDSSGLISWTPTSADIGEHSVVARANDGEFYIDQGWVLSVIDGDIPVEAALDINPTSVNPGETVTITVTANNVAGQITRSVTVDSANVPLNSNGVGQVTLNDIGAHQVVATVTDVSGSDTASATIYVRDPNDTAAPSVDIISPQTDITVTAKMDITGLVDDANLQHYVLAYAPAGSDNFVTLAEGSTPFAEQTIATFDATMLVNGLYDIVLQATDQSGQTSSDAIQVLVDGNLKVGNFSFTVVDLEIPVSGIPIRVTRTYDSRRKHDDLDFGYGWSIGYQDVKVEESRVPSVGWSLNQYPSGPLGLIPLWCIEPLGNLRVTITLPDGDVETFNVRSEGSNGSECTQETPVLDVRLKFVPAAGTLGTLTAVDDSLLRYNASTGNLEFIGSSTPFDPNKYVYTSKQGFEYHLDQNFGIERVKDLNGNTLTYTDNGIIHSDGKSVLFNRDALGRITSITDPMGNAMTYDYDSEGNLQAYTDLEGHTTTYTYVNGQQYPTLAHSLVDIIDPLGRGVIKNIYDDSGRLIAQEDADGVRTEFNHNIDGRESVVTNRRGYITRYFYDDRGNVTVKVDADGATVYEYDQWDNLLSTMNPLGEMSTATYDDRRNQLTQTDDLGHTVTFDYNQRAQETFIYDARGNPPFENRYDSLGNLREVIDPLGHVATQDINAKGLVEKRTDALLGETLMTYDESGNTLTETDAEGHTTTYTYDDNGNVLTESRTRTVNGTPVTETTTYEYDHLNRLVKTTDPLGQVSRVEYDEAGNESARITAVGTANEQRTAFDYDAYRRLIRTTYPDGASEHNQYDAEGNLILSEDRLSHVTQYRYDALNRQIKVIYHDGTFTQTEYDDAGRVIAEIDARGNRTEHGYDRAGRRVLTRNADLKETRFEYDEDGNLTKQIDAKQHETTFEYDALDRKRRTVFHNGSDMREDYDALGRLTLKTDQSGIQTKFDYDSLGRLTDVYNAYQTPKETHTSYAYDEVGNKLTQTDANSHQTTWTYDALGHVLTRTLPEGQQESFTYNEIGNRDSYTDFNGHQTTYGYDNNNRLTSVNYYDGSSETYTYTLTGQRLTATDARGMTAYTYDDRDRLKTETQPDGTVLTYDYDEAGNRILLQTDIPNASTGSTDTTATDYVFDNLNRLYSVTDHHGQVTTYTYDDVGNRETVSYPNGTSTTYVYDALNRLQTMQTVDGSNQIISQFDYTVYPTGHRHTMTDLAGNSSTYMYDELYRLTSETINHVVMGAVVNSYTYDNVGNRDSATENGVTTTYIYDRNDRLVSSTQNGIITTYAYDDNGNTLSKAANGDDTTFTYDARNKLTAAVQHQGGSPVSNVYFEYDIDGNRTQKTDNGNIVNFVVDRNQSYAQVVHETDDQNATQVTYTHGDDLISQDRSASINYYNYDGLGSTRSLTDSAGLITDTYDYNAYGTLLDQSGSSTNSYLYTGEQFDASLGDYYLRARYYGPDIGRFKQMDTWLGNDDNPITLNKYLYANGNPIRFVDYSGNQATLIEVGQSLNIQGLLIKATVAAVAGIIIVNSVDDGNTSDGENTNVISLDEWKERKNEIYRSNGSGNNGDDDDDDDGGYCKLRQEQLLERAITPITLANIGLMGSFQFNQFVKSFNAAVEKHNAECPKNQVVPLKFL